MRTRRPHAKSHFGCLQCKEKRVKCDEGRPSCNRCNKRGSECTYDLFIHHVQGSASRKATSPRPKSQCSSGSNTSISHKNSSRSSRAPTTSTTLSTYSTSPPTTKLVSPEINIISWQSSTPSPNPSGLSTDDHELYQHYLSHVSPTYWSPIFCWGSWDTSIQANAQTRPFLTSGMLMNAAVHLALTQPDRRELHIQTAMKHQSDALAQYQPVFTHGLAASEYEAALGFTALLITSAFGLQSALVKSSVETLEIQHAYPVTEIQSIFALFRGMTQIYKLGSFDQTELRPLRTIMAGIELADGIPHAGPGEFSLDMLERDFLKHDYQRAQVDYIESGDYDFSISGESSSAAAGQSPGPQSSHQPTDIYISLITSLRCTFRRLKTEPQRAAYPFMWASMTPRTFSGLLAANRPLALIILAHWAVCLHELRDQWWIDDWGVRLIATIARTVGHEWRQYILWPLQEVGLDQQDLLHGGYQG